jgi:blocked-early-in-transport protein 1|uniref:t-SNARE coiled-coil homology domain-containing protein n=1 Tax=Eutreptiella gymnastica TaxID=73025 RepID=A0A7S4GIY5_9EUGL|mmetsp:Transcript_11807/g.21557  ORF Transcript_11807/g.21557 Transcript_11807/m.21557 type:complete len:132 (+) Transcript_11807:83-478(+)
MVVTNRQSSGGMNPRSNLFGGNGSRGRQSRGHDEQTEEQLERENEDELENLRDKVATIKSIALDIQDEVKSHNRLLDKMGDQFSTATASLKGTMGRLNAMMAHGGSKHMCFLALFVFMVFIALYWLLKTRK